MSAGAFKILVVLNGSACLHGDVRGQRLHSKHQITLSDRPLHSIASATDVSIRYRNLDGDLVSDEKAKLLVQNNGRSLLYSELLANELINRAHYNVLLYLHLEQASGVIRVIVHFSTVEQFEGFSEQRPELRLSSYDLPPAYSTAIEPSSLRDGMDSDSTYDVLLRQIQTEDPKLFTVHTEKFERTSSIGPSLKPSGKPQRRGQLKVSHSATQAVGSISLDIGDGSVPYSHK